MKRTFTFSYSRKVSTAAYENADVFIAEGIEVDPKEDSAAYSRFPQEKEEIVRRVRTKVDQIAKEART